ncbi:DUF7108 family protein [Halobaculum litoreum]|uniref:RnhA operon protein n=1 Tax=Halobaculum litoreum TaxID=3031998 RepID=A0ABD5XLT8_9EURY|nr:rnhA operon protein [Halobaculum sp. DT92]
MEERHDSEGTDDVAPTEDRPDDRDEELPEPTVDAAERLTRLAREAVDAAEADAYREDRGDRLAEHDFTARVREEDDTLVLYPEEWIEDGTVRIDRIDDTGRAVEVPLSGPGDPDDWQAVEDHNTELVEAVAADYDDVHAANARAFADFMGNHYAKPMDAATADEVSEFLAEYFPRNAWPSEEQRDAVEASVRYVFEAADEPTPL